MQEFAGEIRITQIISPEAFADTDIAFFACSPEIIEAYAASGSAFPDLTIDLTQTGRKGTLFLKGVSDASRLQGAGYYVNPHPAAIALGRVLARIQSAFHMESVSVTIMEPASERGSAAIDELQEQTVELLNFQPVEQARSSADSSRSIFCPKSKQRGRTESLVRQQLSDLLGKRMPSLRRSLPFRLRCSTRMPFRFSQLKESASVEPDRCEPAGRWKRCHRSRGGRTDPVTGYCCRQRCRACGADRDGPCPAWILFSCGWSSDNLRIAASNALQIAESLMFAPAPPR